MLSIVPVLACRSISPPVVLISAVASVKLILRGAITERLPEPEVTPVLSIMSVLVP